MITTGKKIKAPKKLPADDLFESSSMSFGEHLEELRKALVKAFLWLGAGVIIGLMFANPIVRYMQEPLEQAILDFHIRQAKEEYRRVNGRVPSDTVAEWIAKNRMLPEHVFVDPNSFGKPDALLTDPSKAEEGGEIDAVPQANDPQAVEVGAAEVKTPMVDDAELAERLAAVNASPWAGVDEETLVRLRPFVLWRNVPSKLVSLTPVEGFMIWLKAGFVAGFVIASPGMFWHIWQFFAAGLYPHERRYVYWYLPLSLLLFLAGVCLAFFLVFRLVLGFLMTYTTGLNVEFTPRLNDYMSFALFLPLGFGFAFQLPIAMLGLHRFGIVTADAFFKHWRIAVLVIAFLSMLFTPADIYSMLGLFIPLTALYFLGIVLCIYMPRGAGFGAPPEDPRG
ncbi:MAG: Sec-independent protein translocase protein TatC [Pirellulaceae bacterium]|nr:MAG: Sec-independent protein translocase protein TatC [Pirellulaceae bacterium]